MPREEIVSKPVPKSDDSKSNYENRTTKINTPEKGSRTPPGQKK